MIGCTRKRDARGPGAEERAPIIEPAMKAAGVEAEDARRFLKSVKYERGLTAGWGDESYGFMYLK